MTINVNKLIFNKNIKKNYTVLFPNMLDIHFELIKNIFKNNGYKIEVLKNESRAVVDEGSKYVHNDTCYPAILVIGQMIDALRSGKYNTHKVILLITQTGGGCRASNYIHLLRKALKNAGYEYVPVVSLNFGRLGKCNNFKISLSMLKKCIMAIVYGDLLMLLNNQVKPYEIHHGDSDVLVRYWTNVLNKQLRKYSGCSKGMFKNVAAQIVKSFKEIPIKKENNIKVGIVGEIYMKYASLGNNDLEQFLYRQNCEIMIPGILDFFIYCLCDTVQNSNLYGGKRIKKQISECAINYLSKLKCELISAVKKNSDFRYPFSFEHLQNLVKKVIGLGCQMGEGWLLTAEIMELNELGYENIVCAQPFGCLPNHIVGKGMVKKIKSIYPFTNIVAIDYDPSATKVNQENRIKLMLEVAKEKLVTV